MAAVIPPLRLKRLRKNVLAFFGQVNVGANFTVVGGPITYRYRVTNVKIGFRDDAAYNALVYVLVSEDNSVSVVGVPTGRSVFSTYGNIGAVVGEGIFYDFDMSIETEEAEKYIKVHMTNNNGYNQNICAFVTIEEVG